MPDTLLGDARRSRIDSATRGVEALRRAALDSEKEFAADLAAVAPSMRESARNLAHYLGVRRLDVRALQEELARLGLSSLGRMEAHVMASLEAVLAALYAMRGQGVPEDAGPSQAIDFDRGYALLDAHANGILGPARPGTASTRIMVTIPGEAADDPALIADLVENGMDVMRINCAHDDAGVWERMLAHLKAAEAAKGRRCKVAFDLGGPKLRTGPIEPDAAGHAWIRLHPGDRLEVLLGDAPGRGFVSCALPQVFQCARVGQPILFDDGKIRGRIQEVTDKRLVVEITAAKRGAAKLRGEKGINLPETHLGLPALTPKDLQDLAFAARYADMIELSFVHRRKDIDALFAALAAMKAPPVGVVLKIETRAAFERLPALLLQAMRHPSIAVMVARGDLGVEIGFERLAEVQEEILWLCEAAHVPVIWATQVLESLAKGGMPSRAEVTDAAMSSRAECVMLNKGPFIRETLRFLADVLGRMQEHQRKKTSRLRKLRVSAPAD